MITRMTFSTWRICSREATSKRVGTDPTFSNDFFAANFFADQSHCRNLDFASREQIRPKTGLNNKSIPSLVS